MNRKFFKTALFGVGALFLLAGSALAAGSAQTRLRQAATAVKTMNKSKAAPDLAAALRDAKAVVVFPHLNKAGFVIGGQYGEGVLLRRTSKGWNGPAFFSLSSGSVGLQIGVASSMVIMTVNTDEGLRAFTRDGFKLGADVTAAAGPGGRTASASATNHGGAGIYTYAVTQGGFAGVALSGGVIKSLPTYSRQYWGRDVTVAQAMDKRASGRSVQPLVKQLNALMGR